jgi:hypothetical protein
VVVPLPTLRAQASAQSSRRHRARVQRLAGDGAARAEEKEKL